MISFGALKFNTSNLIDDRNGAGRGNPFAYLPKEINKLLGNNAKHYTYQCKADDTEYTFYVNKNSAEDPSIVKKLDEFEDTFVANYANVEKTDVFNNPILPSSVEKISNPTRYEKYIAGHWGGVWE